METFYRRFQVEDGSYNQLTQEVVEEERRPMIEVAGYQNRELGS